MKSYARMFLRVLLGSVPLGLAHGWLAHWFDPCIGKNRYEACTMGELHLGGPPHCSWGVCDHRPGALETTSKVSIVVASIVLVGFNRRVRSAARAPRGVAHRCHRRLAGAPTN